MSSSEKPKRDRERVVYVRLYGDNPQHREILDWIDETFPSVGMKGTKSMVPLIDLMLGAARKSRGIVQPMYGEPMPPYGMPHPMGYPPAYHAQAPPHSQPSPEPVQSSPVTSTSAFPVEHVPIDRTRVESPIPPSIVRPIHADGPGLTEVGPAAAKAEDDGEKRAVLGAFAMSLVNDLSLSFEEDVDDEPTSSVG